MIPQIELIAIAVLSAFIAHQFYISKDGRVIILMIRLFCSKIWVYGGAALYYWLFPHEDIILVRIVLNLPMVIVMFQIWTYIRLNNQK